MTDAHVEVQKKALALLSRFVDPALVAERLALLMQLRPQPEDYARVFASEVVEQVRTAYEGLWASPQLLNPPLHQTIVELHLATGHELATHKGAALEFPGGYLTVAELLIPERYWVCWKFGTPGQPGGISYDGLVLLEDRWVWFPKPWRAIALKPTPPSVAKHWNE